VARRGRGRRLILNGHIDTNPVTEGWTVDPWGGLVDDKFVYGIGVSNTKAGDVAFYCAAKTLLDAGVRLRGDAVLMYVVGELQGGIGTVKALEGGLRGDCFVVAEQTDLAALTLHAGAFNFVIELTGATRHMSKREEAVDAIAAACALVPRINRATFSGAATDEHRSLNRANVGVLRGSLTSGFNATRPPQIADFVRLAGSARYAPSQSEESVLADLGAMLKDLEAEFPGLKTRLLCGQREAGRPAMLPFEVSRQAPIVRAVNRAYEAVRGAPQPTGAIPPPCFYWTDAAHFQRIARMEGVVCGPGGRYNTMPDERVDIADYLDMIRICMLTIVDICG
jgi:acetylornithine deacetylase